MSIESELAALEKARSDRMVTLIVVVCAMLIGSSTGFLVANRDVTHAQNAAAVASPLAIPKTVKPASSAVTAKTEAAKAAATAPGLTLTSLTSSLGAIRYSQGTDSANFDLDLGTTLLLRAEKLHNPERIYFDLRNERGTTALSRNGAASLEGELVAGVRAAERESGAVRLVLDLKLPCDYSYQVVPEPSPHLVITLKTHPQN